MLIDKKVQSHEFLTAQDLLQRNAGRTLCDHAAVGPNLFLHLFVLLRKGTQAVHQKMNQIQMKRFK